MGRSQVGRGPKKGNNVGLPALAGPLLRVLTPESNVKGEELSLLEELELPARGLTSSGIVRNSDRPDEDAPAELDNAVRRSSSLGRIGCCAENVSGRNSLSKCATVGLSVGDWWCGNVKALAFTS